MPYDSDAQRRFMHARHPGIASEWDQEIRSKKRRKDVSKRLASSMRAIKMGEEITNPHIATRVMAHDRGKVAGKLIASGRKQEAAVNAKYRKPIKARSPLTAPLSIAGDEINRFYAMQSVHGTQNAAKQVQRQGQWAREMSRSQIGKSMRLSEIRKAALPEPRPKDERKRKGVATGVGAVGVGAGLAGGGVPGMKATRISSDYMKGPVRQRPGNLVRARRGGIFGYRINAHQTLRDFNLSPQGVKYHHPGPSNSAVLRRAAERGKDVPEEKIIRHLKVARKASHGVLAGGVGLTAYGLHRKKVEKADRDRRDAALVAGGGTAAAGSYGGARLLESQGRKWTRQSAANFDAAQKILPELGGHSVKPGKVKIKGHTVATTKVPAVRAETKVKDVGEKALRGKTRGQIVAAGRHHGMATNQSYFGHVYGTMGQGMRKIALPASVAAAGVGGLSALGRKRRQQQGVTKAYRPTYFQGSAPTERLTGENQRFRTETQHQGAKGAALALGGASTAALGARWAGHQAAPAAIKAAAGVARTKGVPKEIVSDASQKATRLHHWAKPRRGRLLAASAVASGGALGAGTIARWKKDEITGISQDLGRASAGDRGQNSSKRVTKSAAVALAAEAGMRGSKELAKLPPEVRNRIYRGVAIGGVGATGTGGTLWAMNRGRRTKREHTQLKAAGGLTGPVMKGEIVGFGKALGGSNVREYSHLPENIRSNVAYGSIGPRRNPMSALDLFASSRIMAHAQRRANRKWFHPRRLSTRTANEVNYAGGRAMLYSPTGRGSAFL